MKKHVLSSLVFATCATLIYACGGDDTTPAITPDSGAKDTSTLDTSVADTGSKDSSAADTSVADTGNADTSVADTGPVDAGPTNGCVNFADHTQQNDPRLITFPGVSLTPFYTPSCMKITNGQTVTFQADKSVTFGNHPLQSENEVGTPIVNTNTGTKVSFQFNQSGTFGFHCLFHGGSSMKGAILVQ